MGVSDKAEVETTREKILGAAAVEFAEYGKAGARVDRIAAKAGVNKAMIYYHFNSKDNLYDVMVMERVGAIASMLHDQIVQLDTLADIAGTVVEMHTKMMAQNPALRKILLRELAEDDSVIIDHIAEAFRRSGVPEVLRSRLVEGITSGRIRDIDLQQSMGSLVSMSIGFFLLFPILTKTLGITDTDKMIAGRKGAVVDLFLNGVLPR